MASGINSRARSALVPLSGLTPAVREALARGPVPLLVLRLPEFERIAWREGKRAARRLERETAAAFTESTRRILRTGDLCAHDPGSECFAIAMTAPSREPRAPSPVDIRAVLERVAAAISLACGLRVESGWTLLARVDERLDRDVATALERGARERERYEFFSAVGHELRTPLAAIRGYLETVLDEDVDPPASRQFLETARREALRMGRLLEGMFEFSLLDLSSEALTVQSCELAAQIRGACDAVRPLAHKRGIVLDPSCRAGVRAALDGDACLQLLANLLENAVKYGRAGGVVRVAGRAAGAQAVIVVEDDGPGISPAERESIFGLRVRGSGAQSRPGTGIGLAIVKMIVDRAGGAVRVTESVLGGARFEVFLPRKQDASRQESRVAVS